MSKPTVEAVLQLIRTRLWKAITNLDANDLEGTRYQLITAIRYAKYAFDIAQEEEETMLKDAHYQMTFCCEATAVMVELGLLIPTWNMQNEEMQPALALNETTPILADTYNDPVTLIYLYYCPNCGKKIQVTAMIKGRYRLFPEEAYGGQEAGGTRSRESDQRQQGDKEGKGIHQKETKGGQECQP